MKNRKLLDLGIRPSMRRRALGRLAHQYLVTTCEEDLKCPLPQGDEYMRAEARASRIVIDTAFHEASHAVVGRHLVDANYALICIEHGSEELETPGWAFCRMEAQSLEEISARLGAPDGLRTAAERLAMFHLAGPAQRWLREDEPKLDVDELLYDQSEGERDDDAGLAHRVLLPFESDVAGRRRWVFRLLKRVLRMIQEPRLAQHITILAEALLDVPLLQGDDLDALLDDVPFRRHRWRGPCAIRP